MQDSKFHASSTPSSLDIDRHPGVDRVRAALAGAGLNDRITVLPDAARTAQAAAAALGCTVGQIANSLVFRLPRSDRALLILSSGARRVSTERASTLLGEPVAKADAAFVRERTGFAIGGVAPVGHAAPLEVLIERSLFDHARIWAAAGHPHTVFPLTPEELVSLTGGTVVDLAE